MRIFLSRIQGLRALGGLETVSCYPWPYGVVNDCNKAEMSIPREGCTKLFSFDNFELSNRSWEPSEEVTT